MDAHMSSPYKPKAHTNFPLTGLQAWELIQTVPPFHATTFQSGLAANPTRAGLDILQACAHRLLYELNVEGLATGLDVFVEARHSTLKDLQSHHMLAEQRQSLLCREQTFAS